MNKKRIVITALVGTIALAAVSVSISLAWYGSSNRLSVNYLDVEMTGDDHLKLSLTGEEGSFVTSLTDTQLKDPNNEFRFEPVSTMFKSKWMDEQKDMPVFYDSSSSLTPSSGEPELSVAKLGYFSKKIYLLSDTNRFVTFDGEKCFFKNPKIIIWNTSRNSIHKRILYHTRYCTLASGI